MVIRNKPVKFNYPLFSRKELRITEIEEKAMAAAAKIGLSRIPKEGYKTPAATGTRMLL